MEIIVPEPSLFSLVRRSRHRIFDFHFDFVLSVRIVDLFFFPCFFVIPSHTHTIVQVVSHRATAYLFEYVCVCLLYY